MKLLIGLGSICGIVARYRLEVCAVHMLKSSRHPFALVLTAAALYIGGASEAQDTRVAMHEIFQSMHYLLPLSVGDQWKDAQHTEQVRDALRTLSERTLLLAEHAKSDQHDFRFLARTLTYDLREVLLLYEHGETESAASLLLLATNSCIACHIRLPTDRDSPLSAQFVEETVLEDLPLEQRARLEIATRRFDDALTSLEALFTAPEVNPGLLLGALTDYLIVAIRVRQDFERVEATLTEFSNRPDLWTNLQSDVDHWLDALHEFRSMRLDPPTLALGIEIMEQAARQQRFIGDRRSLVYYVLASSVLHRYADSSPAHVDMARAYYLLGLAEFRIGRDYWIAQGEMFLEAAIMLSPGAPVARDAYALLEEEVLLGYTGSAGLHLPDHERERLAGLQALIEAAREPALH